MSYRVVVDVPETLVKSEKEAVQFVKQALVGGPIYSRPMLHVSWMQRVKSYVKTRGAERAQAEKNPLAMDIQDVAERLINISNRISDSGFELQESPMRTQLRKEEQAQEQTQAQEIVEPVLAQEERRVGRTWHGRTAHPLRREGDLI